MTSAPEGQRTVPYACPYCAEDDLRPVEQGRWHCRSCLRVFSVAFHGIEPAAFSQPPTPSTATARPATRTSAGSTP